MYEMHWWALTHTLLQLQQIVIIKTHHLSFITIILLRLFTKCGEVCPECSKEIDISCNNLWNNEGNKIYMNNELCVEEYPSNFTPDSNNICVKCFELKRLNYNGKCVLSCPN